jgi:hypothetical protein
MILEVINQSAYYSAFVCPNNPCDVFLEFIFELLIGQGGIRVSSGGGNRAGKTLAVFKYDRYPA